MASATVSDASVSNGEDPKSRQYAALKRRMALVSMGLDVAYLWRALASGAAQAWAARLSGWSPWWWQTAIYVAGLAAPWTVVLVPLDWYRGFRLEHQFGLSRQSWRAWTWRWLKAEFLGGLMLAGMAILLMGTLRASPIRWWAWASAAWTLWAVILTQWMPVVLVPIFYRQRPVTDPTLTARLQQLAARCGAPVRGVFEIDFSRETAKANACLCGLGTTRRILVTDTMTRDYTPEEIEAVLAHELGHHRLHHLPRLFGIGAISVVACCGIVAQLLPGMSAAFRVVGPRSLATLPVIGLALSLLQIALIPVHNGLSRGFERAADRFALELTRAPEAFIAAMRRLQRQNLAEAMPSRWVEWFWYDHPPIAKRIAMAEAYR